jgi:2-oxoglutarate ferredoxin oxidoreductase subunit alpha
MNLVIGGEAGQGIATIGELLCKALVGAGHEIVVSQSYHSRIRGGHNTFTIRIANDTISAPIVPIDILAALNRETVELHRDELKDSGLIVADLEWEMDGENMLQVDYEEMGKKKYFNTIVLGILGSLLDLDLVHLTRGIEKALGKKKEELVQENLKALEKSYEWAGNQKIEAFKLTKPQDRPKNRLLLNGNQAIALGAMAAGVKFGAFYPMTPATSVMLNIIAHAKEMDIIVEQAEDELGALNMAIGASFGGAPSIVATSGGGYALMTEAVSLAGMTETPVVIVVAQRPGPATGLPTRTEQGELNFILHGGHGEFARLILAPGTIESCFQLTRRAFHLAEKYQTPCFIMTDQFMADSFRGVDPEVYRVADLVKAGVDPETVNEEYKRYALTENSISPRLLPGISKHLVVADSDEHDEEGHITEDLSLRVKMVDKRLKKLTTLQQESLPPSYEGPEKPELLLVCWGSTMGPVLETVERLRHAGRSIATLCFEQVWPLNPGQFMSYLENAGTVVCVEGNATGQFRGLLRRETGFQIDDMILRYDGLPFTIDYIMERLERLGTKSEK